MQLTAVKVKGDSGTEYEVKAIADGSLWCSCPAMRFQRQRPASERMCKHIEFVTRKFAEHFAKVAQL